MKEPTWFKNELKLIHPKYFTIFDSRRRKYYIRKWKTAYPRPNTWKRDSTPICQVPYPTLDHRILDKMREGLYWAKKAKEYAIQIDRENDKMVEQEEIEHDYITRYMAKHIWGYYREKTLDLGNPNLASKKVGLGEI